MPFHCLCRFYKLSPINNFSFLQDSSLCCVIKIFDLLLQDSSLSCVIKIFDLLHVDISCVEFLKRSWITYFTKIWPALMTKSPARLQYFVNHYMLSFAFDSFISSVTVKNYVCQLSYIGYSNQKHEEKHEGLSKSHQGE